MKAVILAGGKGVRLKPYTICLPKPLVPIGDEPIMKLLLNNIAKQGIRDATLCVNHMSDLIESYFGDGSALGLKLSYSKEPIPLGTVGPIKLISCLPDDFLVMNADVMTDLSLRRLFHDHKTNDAIMTVAVYRRKVAVDFGVITYGADHIVSEFLEKPDYELSVSMGIYAFNKRILDYVPPDTYFGFDDLMYELLENHEKVRVCEHHGYWLDIGRPEDYEKANNDLTEVLGLLYARAGNQ